jgi:hypothetical protein
VLGVSVFPPFSLFFDWIVELFRQCGIIWFSFYGW